MNVNKAVLRIVTGVFCTMLCGVVFSQNSPDSVLYGTKHFRKRVVVSGLAGPWELTWGPDNTLWVTERIGKRITRVNPDTGGLKIAATLPEVSAPGSQDGLLGMALHPELLRGTGSDYVFVFYTYVDQSKEPHETFADPGSPYRFLYGKVVRLTYNKTDEALSDPITLISGLPVGNDHISGRLKIGPDRKLYLTLGDEGHNQLGNYCFPIEAQRLPTREEVNAQNYSAYVGKSLRLNMDGSIPEDNPELAGVISHVYTFGHRNAQGLDFAPDGTLYASEQGPKTDDELNILKAGGNYGWPHVAGFKDGKAYEYARWSDSTVPCSQLTFSDLAIPPSVPREPESAFTKPFVEPIATMFTVPTGYNFSNPACRGIDFICWPTVGASSIEFYASNGHGIPGWDKVLLVTTLKRGSLYVQHLSKDGQHAVGYMSRYFQSDNRYRDTAIHPNGRTIYIATDPGGMAESIAGGATSKMENPGAILAFDYESEGVRAVDPRTDSRANQQGNPSLSHVDDRLAIGTPPQFTASQAAAGKVLYDANCATCHGSTLTNGTFAPPLAGQYFRDAWLGRTVRAFFDKAKTMPPASPATLPDKTYADIVAYILSVNQFEPGRDELPSGSAALDRMVIK